MAVQDKQQQYPGARLAAALLVLWAVVTMGWWALAFLPASGKEWMVTFQAICFGTKPSGLPDARGWSFLILAPGSFLLSILVAYSAEVKKAFHAIMTWPKFRVLTAILAGSLIWEVGWVATRIYAGIRMENASYDPVQNGILPDSYPRTDKPAPDFSLTDQNGNLMAIKDFRGNAVILTFAFAHCQTVCPTLVTSTVKAMESAQMKNLKAVFITLDPWRDTPKSLPQLARRWKLPESAHILSGDPVSVTTTLDGYSVPWQRDEKTGDVSHPALVYVLDPQGRIAYTFNNPPAAWLVEAARRVTHP